MRGDDEALAGLDDRNQFLVPVWQNTLERDLK
jgi:hypothetical protein